MVRQVEVAFLYRISARHLRCVLNELEVEVIIEKRDKIQILDQKIKKTLTLPLILNSDFLS